MAKTRILPLIMTLDGRPAEVSFKKSLGAMETEMQGFQRRVKSSSSGMSGFSPADLKAINEAARQIPANLPKAPQNTPLIDDRPIRQSRIADTHVKEYKAIEKEAERSARARTQIEQSEMREIRQIHAEKVRMAERSARERTQVEARAARDIQNVERERLDQAGAGYGNLRQIAVATFAAIVLAAAGLIYSTTNAALTLDTLKRGLVAVAGSTQAANAQFEKLRGVARLPGLGIKEAVEGAIKLQAAGISFGLAERTLRAFGNALSTVGKGKAELAGVNEQLAQIAGKGKIMAQDIRIISEYVPQLRKAMTAAFGTADTEELQKRGVTAEEFLTKINAQLEKLPQMTGGAKNAIENFQDSWFLASAAIGEKFLPALTAVLELAEPLLGWITRNQTAVTLLIGAVIALSLAMVGLATSAIPSFISTAAAAISSIRLLGQVMVGTASLIQGASATMAVATGGWIALALAVGGLIYYLSQYETAADKAAKITLDQVSAQAESLAQSRALASEVQALATSQNLSASEHEKLNAVIGRLDPATQAYINSLKNEKETVDALNRSIKEKVDQDRSILEATLRTSAAAIIEQTKALEFQNNVIKSNQSNVELNTSEILKGNDALGLNSRLVKQETAAILGASQEVKTLTEGIGENTAKLLASTNGLNLSREEFVKFLTAAGHTKDEVERLAVSYDRLKQKQGEATNSTITQTSAIDQQTKALKGLKSATDDMSSARQGRIDSIVGFISENAKPGTGVKGLKDLMVMNPQLAADIEQERTANKLKKELNEFISPPERRARAKKTDTDKLSDQVSRLRFEIKALQSVGSNDFNMKFELEGMQRFKSDLERILDLRRDLNLEFSARLPDNSFAATEELRRLEGLQRVRDGVRKVIDEQREAEEALAVAMRTATLPVVNAATIAETAYQNAIRERGKAEQQLTADIIVAQRLRRDALADEVGATKKAYQSLRIDLIKELDDLDETIKQNAVLELLERGGETTINQKISGRVDLKEPKVPSELTRIAEHAADIRTSVAQIAVKMGATPADRSPDEEFNAQAFLPKLTSFLSSLGAHTSINAGQTGAHNRLNLDHRNAIDVGLDPGTPQGDALAAWLSEQGVPFRQISAADIARGVKGTSPHTHIGEPSHGTQTDFKRGTLLKLAPQLDRAGGSNTPLDFAALAPAFHVSNNLRVSRLGQFQESDSEDVERVTTNMAGGESYLVLKRAAALKLADAERGTLARTTRDTIRVDEARLHNQLIDFDLDLAGARTHQAIVREQEDRRTALTIKLAEADLTVGRKRDIAYVARLEKKAEEERVTGARATVDQLITAEALLKQYRASDPETLRAAAERGRASDVQEQIGVEQEIGRLRQQISTVDPAAEASRYALAWLKAIRSVQEADIAARESMIASQVRIADQTVYHADQANAKVLEFIASQKGLTDIVADAKIGLIQKTYDGIDAALTRILPKGNAVIDVFKEMAAQLLKLAASRILMKLLGLSPADNEEEGAGGVFNLGGGGSGSGGGLLSSLRGLLSGGGNNSQGGGGGGGFGGIIQNFRANGFSGGVRSLLGLGGGSATSAASPAMISAAGSAAGLGSGAAAASLLAGGATTAAAGTAAGVGAGGAAAAALGGGGAAAGAAAGGGSAGASAGLLALASNPITLAIAGAAVGGLLLWRHFRNGTEKKLRKGIQSEYQIDVKDMKTLNQIKLLGEGVYGKGQVSKHLTEVVRLDQVKELLATYAEQTGQTSSKLATNKQLGDPEFAQNQFIRRQYGGSVPGSTRGHDYVRALLDGGEHVINSGTVSREGGHAAFDELRDGRARIVRGSVWRKMMERLRQRAVSAATAAATPALPDAGTTSGRGGGSSTDSETKALLARLSAALEAIEPTDEESIVRIGAQKAPEAIGEANTRALRSGTVRAGQQEALGMRNY